MSTTVVVENINYTVVVDTPINYTVAVTEVAGDTVVVEETVLTTEVTEVNYNPYIVDITELTAIAEAKVAALVTSGLMARTTYDTNNNGTVDDAELVNGLTVETAVPQGAVFTDTTYSIGDGGLTEKNYTTAEATKVGYITVTQAVNLDNMESDIAALSSAITLKGLWNASLGLFPTSTKSGDSWIVSVGGTVDSIVFDVNDRIVALVNSASTTVYANNWHKLDYTDQVLSVNGATGAVTITTITGNAGSATTASGLTSATTIVSVSSATAPTAGQVLTATGSTEAAWQTPSAGGSSTNYGFLNTQINQLGGSF